METINVLAIKEKAEEMAKLFQATIVEENESIFVLMKNDTRLCYVLCEEDYVFFSIDVTASQKYYEDVHSFIYNRWIPELIGASKKLVNAKIVYRDIDEVEVVQVKGHKIEFNYGFNYITFKIYKKSKKLSPDSK